MKSLLDVDNRIYKIRDNCKLKTYTKYEEKKGIVIFLKAIKNYTLDFCLNRKIIFLAD